MQNSDCNSRKINKRVNERNIAKIGAGALLKNIYRAIPYVRKDNKGLPNFSVRYITACCSVAITVAQSLLQALWTMI